MWEVFYLSGGRLAEIQKLKIKDILIEGNNVSIRINYSKTRPREVPLSGQPNHLIRWLEKHPFRENPENPLWISYASRNFLKPLAYSTIGVKFNELIRKAGLKSTLSIHCFRKSYATNLFEARSKDGGIIYDDKEIGQLLGWKPHTVVKRRQEYDLRNTKDLKKKIFKSTGKSLETYDNLKKERDMLENQYQKKITDMEQDMYDMKRLIDQLMTATTGVSTL
jgi:integrase